MEELLNREMTDNEKEWVLMGMPRSIIFTDMVTYKVKSGKFHGMNWNYSPQYFSKHTDGYGCGYLTRNWWWDL